MPDYKSKYVLAFAAPNALEAPFKRALRECEHVMGKRPSLPAIGPRCVVAADLKMDSSEFTVLSQRLERASRDRRLRTVDFAGSVDRCTKREGTIVYRTTADNGAVHATWKELQAELRRCEITGTLDLENAQYFVLAQGVPDAHMDECVQIFVRELEPVRLRLGALQLIEWTNDVDGGLPKWAVELM